MMNEIIRELQSKKLTKLHMSRFYVGQNTVELQRVQKAVLEATKETQKSKEFDAVKKGIKKIHNMQNAKRSKGMPQNKCKYCGTLHEPRRCLVYG